MIDLTCPGCGSDFACACGTGPDPRDVEAFPLVAVEREAWSTKAPPVERRASLRFPVSVAEASHDRAERLADELSEARARIRELETRVANDTEALDEWAAEANRLSAEMHKAQAERDRALRNLALQEQRTRDGNDERQILRTERDNALRDLAHACRARNDAVRELAVEREYGKAWAVLRATARHAERILENASRWSVTDFRNEMRALIEFADMTVREIAEAALALHPATDTKPEGT